jgi:SAM-dependent methyltransferase
LEADATTRLLDVACGPGYVPEVAAARGISVVGVDFSDNMIKKARALHPGMEFRVGDAQDLPFEDETFDAVSMNFGMLHLANPEQAMKETLRVLTSGGRFAFTVWAPPEEALGFKIILQAVEKYGESVAVPHGPDFFFYSRPEECKIALTTIGFLTPKVMLVDLSWHLRSPEEFFTAFYGGTARTGGLLRRQPVDARRRIEDEVRRTLTAYSAADGSIEIPMPAVLAWAVKA